MLSPPNSPNSGRNPKITARTPWPLCVFIIFFFQMSQHRQDKIKRHFDSGKRRNLFSAGNSMETTKVGRIIWADQLRTYAIQPRRRDPKVDAVSHRRPRLVSCGRYHSKKDCTAAAAAARRIPRLNSKALRNSPSANAGTWTRLAQTK